MVLGLKEGVGAQYLRCTELGQGFQQGISDELNMVENKPIYLNYLIS